MAKKNISKAVRRTVEAYIADMEDQEITDLYELVLKEVEAPMLNSVLRHTGNNQSKTATMLGLSRGTLRKKLRKYRLL
ncbi:uncharacterized protein METZ01_LOCUS451593 [marine metagenome]|uniref:Putative Fis-like DNA-binding protein n=1 Tax=marine metagenome TaxID=408172 RepID=A0A382ZTY5_9ZZZZ